MATGNDVNLTINAKDNASAKLKDVAAGLAIVGAAAGAALKKGLDTFIEFDKASNKLKGLLTPAEQAAGALKNLQGEAMNVGAQLPLMNADIVQGAIEFKKLGFSAEEVEVALEGLGFATVGNDMASMGDVAAIAGGTLNQFSLQAEDTANVLDVMTKAGISSGTSFEDIAGSMQYAGLVSAGAGQSFEETTKLIGLMANASLIGQKAGRNLSTAITTLSKNVDASTGKLKGTNVALVDAEGNYRDLSDVVFDLKDEMSGLNEIERTLALETLAGKEGALALMAVMANTVETADELEAALANADGTLVTMVENMQEGASGAMMMFEAQMDSFWTKLGAAVSTYIEPFMRALTELIGWINQNETAMAALAGLLSGVFAAGLVGAAILLWAIIAPAAPIIAAFAAIGVAIGVVMQHFDTLAAFFEPFTSKVQEFIDAVVAKFMQWVEDVKVITAPLIEWFQEHWDTIVFIWEAAWEVLMLGWTIFWEGIFTIFEGFWQIFSGTIDTVLAILQGDWGRAWEGVKTIFTGVWNVMTAFLQSTLNAILGFIGLNTEEILAMIGAFGEILQALWDGLWGGIQATVDAVGGAIMAVVNAIAETIKAVIDTISTLIRKAQELAEWGGAQLAGAAGAVGLAEGGPAKAGKTYVVGEEGPEIFIPNTSGTIIPNNQLTQNGGGSPLGGSTSIVINVQGNFVGDEDEAERFGDMILGKLGASTAFK